MSSNGRPTPISVAYLQGVKYTGPGGHVPHFLKVRILSLSLSSGRNIKRSLKDAVDIGLNLSTYRLDFVCDDHQDHMRYELIDLLARTRIHHFVRIRNRELQQLEHTRKQKQNRKAKKVMHN